MICIPAPCRSYGGIEGRIVSPRGPRFFLPSDSCEFTIESPANTTIAVYFNLFRLMNSVNCTASSLEVYHRSFLYFIISLRFAGWGRRGADEKSFGGQAVSFRFRDFFGFHLVKNDTWNHFSPAKKKKQADIFSQDELSIIYWGIINKVQVKSLPPARTRGRQEMHFIDFYISLLRKASSSAGFYSCCRRISIYI